MKIQKLLIFAVVLGAVTASAQNPPSGTISSTVNTSQSFTNRQGTAYSTEQLAGQFQTLRASVEDTLPLLSSYLESVSNTATTGGRSIGGTVTDILSGVLNRTANQNSGNNYQAQGTNVVRILQGLLGSTGSSAATNATSLRDLNTLQSQLQSVSSILQRLNVGTNVTINLTPTGR
jgi:hypothetical protein